MLRASLGATPVSRFIMRFAMVGLRNITYTMNEIGHLAHSTVLCKAGDTVVHSALCLNSNMADQTFLALTVDYRSRMYAWGAMPSNPMRRERNAEEEILVARLIDRAVRPMFPKELRSELQLTITTHSTDCVNDPIVLSINAASMTLLNSSIQWNGPIGCVRVGCFDGELVVNPPVGDMKKSSLNLLFAGNSSRPVMIDADGLEISEELMIKAFELAQVSIQPIISDQIRKKKVEQSLVESINVETKARAVLFAKSVGFEDAVSMFKAGCASKSDRGAAETDVRNSIIAKFHSHPDWCGADSKTIQYAVDEAIHDAFRRVVLEGFRVDGRKMDEVRPIGCYPNYLPRLNGSAFFTRGDTHVLAVATLGQRNQAKTVVALDGTGEQEKRFFLHYDFPSYCTGVLGSSSTLNRRMIGHGALAEKAVAPVLPEFEDFPYSIRVHSECTSSSGSSSMASVCGASLALMDAGVKLKNAVAGVSVGLVFQEAGSIKDDNSLNYKLLTDIIGSEDYHGDMDFKIAGSMKGITAIQLDTKLQNGVPFHIVCEALYHAKNGRRKILEIMNATLPLSREDIKETALRAEIVRFDPERKRHLVGPGGEMLRHIESFYECIIDDEIPGVAIIYGYDRVKIVEARDLVQDLLVIVEVGQVHTAEVQELKDFGAFVRITRTQEALLHISDITNDASLSKKPINELLAVGQRIPIKVIAVDKATGQTSVSRKVLLDPKVPDQLKPIKPTPSTQSMKLAPTFPTIPPRKWSPDYFKNNIATPGDIERAVKATKSS